MLLSQEWLENIVVFFFLQFIGNSLANSVFYRNTSHTIQWLLGFQRGRHFFTHTHLVMIVVTYYTSHTVGAITLKWVLAG